MQTLELISANLYGDWQIYTFVAKRCPSCLMTETMDAIGVEVNRQTKTISVKNVELVSDKVCGGDHEIEGSFVEHLPITAEAHRNSVGWDPTED